MLSIHLSIIILQWLLNHWSTATNTLKMTPFPADSKEIAEGVTNICALNKGNGGREQPVMKAIWGWPCTAQRTQQHQWPPLHSSWWVWGPSLPACLCWRTWVRPVLLYRTHGGACVLSLKQPLLPGHCPFGVAQAFSLLKWQQRSRSIPFFRASSYQCIQGHTPKKKLRLACALPLTSQTIKSLFSCYAPIHPSEIQATQRALGSVNSRVSITHKRADVPPVAHKPPPDVGMALRGGGCPHLFVLSGLCL